MGKAPERVPDLFKNQFRAPEACAAAGISFDALKNLLRPDRSEVQDPAIVLSPDERIEAGASVRYRFSFARVMHFALTVDLLQLGFKPRRAAMLAAGYAMVGDGDRPPCHLYPTGQTFLVAVEGHDNSFIKNVQPKTKVAEFLIHSRDSAAPATVILNINHVDRRVREALGLDPDWGRS